MKNLVVKKKLPQKKTKVKKNQEIQILDAETGEPNLGGRPLKFPTVEILQEKIDEYFESCWEETEQKVQVGTKKVNGKSKAIFEKRVVRVQVRPYTITGLALALDTSRKVLVEYEDREGFGNAIKRAKVKCENYIEEGMLTGRLESTPSIFNMKNNFGWKDVQEVVPSGTIAPSATYNFIFSAPVQDEVKELEAKIKARLIQKHEPDTPQN